MIALCTGHPRWKIEGDNVILSFPSGKSEAMRVALNLNQVMRLDYEVRKALIAKLDANKQPEADVISFPKSVMAGA